MGMGSLSESHLELWRKAIFLFTKYTSQEGPFYSAGYRKFLIEYGITGPSGKPRKIDIVAWDPQSSDASTPYYALELTTNPEAKKIEQLEDYSEADPREFYRVGIQSERSPTAILVTSSYLGGHDEFCQLVLGDVLEPKNLEKLSDPVLSKTLSEKKVDLTHVPQTSFTIVPESKNRELKLGMVDPLMLVFGPKYESFTAETIADLALDFISEDIDFKQKKELIQRINELLFELSKSLLKGYLDVDHRTYTPTERGRNVVGHPNSREMFQTNLMKWARSNEPSLDKWIENRNEDGL